MKFLPALLPALVILAWMGSQMHQTGEIEDLDEKISHIENTSSRLSSRQPNIPERTEHPPVDTLKTEAAVTKILSEASQSDLKDDFRFQMQTALQVLIAVEELTTPEFIALIDSLHNTHGSHQITLMIMSRIAAQEAPEEILVNPSGDHWRDSNLRNIAFLKLLQSRLDLCQKLVSENEEAFSALSRSYLKKALLRQALETDHSTAFDSISADDLQKNPFLIPAEDPSIRANVARAALQKFGDDPEQKLLVLRNLIAGAFANGDTEEMIHHLNSFFPDDPTGDERTRALYRSGAIDGLRNKKFSDVQIEKILNSARSISPEREHEFIASIASNWAKADLEGATQWLDRMPASSLRDSATASFANRVSSANPAVGLEWAGTISDPAKAEKVRSEIIARWQKSDPETAEAWLEGQK